MGQYLQLKKQVKLSQLFNLEIAKLIFFCIRYYDLKKESQSDSNIIKLSGSGFELTVNQKLLTDNDLEQLKNNIMNFSNSSN